MERTGERTGRTLPGRLELDGETLVLAREFKDDWLSAVGLYEGPARKLILKSYRERPLFVLPMRWLTRRMARREVEVLAMVEGLRGVPRAFGTHRGVGILHEYLEGTSPAARRARP